MNLPDRLLHHSIDAATNKALPSRRRKSLAADVLLTLAPIALIVLIVLGVVQ